LTLNAAETGHLVFATLHASNVTEAIQRILSAFPAEIRDHTGDQLAQVLQVVVCQTLTHIPKFEELAPVCELFFTSTAARSKIRTGELAGLGDTYYASTDLGCLHREKYRQWLEAKPKLLKSVRNTPPPPAASSEPIIQERYQAAPPPQKKSGSSGSGDTVYTIDDPDDDDLWTAIRDLEKK
jgi:twitching motility protein PilT